MALGSAITDNDVRTALSEATTDLFTLCTANSINKWAKYKPVRDDGYGAQWPAGNAGTYGLNVPTNWDYNKPTGGSYGGTPDEPGRLNDFRGYNHDAEPMFHLLFFPSGTVDNDHPIFSLDMDPAVADLTIEDLSLEDWYFGVKVDATYYSAAQPLSYRSTDQNAALQITMSGLSSGAHTWESFISTAQSIAGAAPATMLSLPAFTGYTISGSFTVDLTVTFDVTAVEAVYGALSFAATGYKSGTNINYTCINTSGTDFTVYFYNPISHALLGSKFTHGDGTMETGSFSSSLSAIDVELA